jgi:hypothetical protein
MTLLQVHDTERTEPGGRAAFTGPELLDYTEQNHVFDAVIASSDQDVLYTSGEGTERFEGFLVTPGPFEFFGMPALRGGVMQASDYEPGAPPVFVLRYKTCVGRFNRDAGILNKQFVLNGSSRTLIGIMPPRFAWGDADVWIPEKPSRAQAESGNVFRRRWGRAAGGSFTSSWWKASSWPWAAPRSDSTPDHSRGGRHPAERYRSAAHAGRGGHDGPGLRPRAGAARLPARPRRSAARQRQGTSGGLRHRKLRDADVFQMVLRMGARLVVLGLAIGLLVSVAVARVIASQLWGVSPYNPATLASVAAVLLVTGLVACWVPARRATRVDPLVALRYE